MSAAGKENNKGLNSPTSGGDQNNQNNAEEEGMQGSGDELGMEGSLTPHSQDGVPPVNQNDELYVVQESLGQIEAILKAESKRRLEANKLTEEYILEYLDKLELSLNN